MNRTISQTRRYGPAAGPLLGFGAIVIAAIVIALVAFGGGRRGDPAVVPVVPTSPPATPVVTPAPSPEPSEEPDGGNDGMPIKVDLENATDHDVYVDIVDRTRLLARAVSGTPGFNASVEPYTVAVEQVDERTLRLSWVDYPIDNALALYIDEVDGSLRLVLVQPAPTGDTDAIAFDRVLLLTFSEPVSADAVEAFLQEGLDTPG